MIVRKLNEIIGSDREVSGETWTSRRLLLRDDSMGFSMHDTLIHAGTTTRMLSSAHSLRNLSMRALECSGP